jgi:hypothetical protein
MPKSKKQQAGSGFFPIGYWPMLPGDEKAKQRSQKKRLVADVYIPFNKAIEFSGEIITRKILLKAIHKGYPVKVRSYKPSSQRRSVHIQDILVLMDKLSPSKNVVQEATKIFGRYKDELIKKQQKQQNLD